MASLVPPAVARRARRTSIKQPARGMQASPRRAAAFPGMVPVHELWWLTRRAVAALTPALGTAASLPHRDSLCNACLFRLHAGMKHLTHCAGPGGRGGISQSAPCWLRSSAIKAVGGVGGSLFSTGEDLGQGWTLQKNPTPKICNNRKLNPTVTLKKGDNGVAWDAPSCFLFAIKAARASGKPWYMFGSCRNVFHCLGKNPEVPKSTVAPESALQCFMCC